MNLLSIFHVASSDSVLLSLVVVISIRSAADMSPVETNRGKNTSGKARIKGALKRKPCFLSIILKSGTSFQSSIG